MPRLMRPSEIRTEADAWTYLAQRWDRPRKVSGWWSEVFPGVWGTLVRGGVCVGLCASIAASPPRLGDDMRSRIAPHSPRGFGSVFWWPLTRDGARQRAAFCRRMAKLAAGEGA